MTCLINRTRPSLEALLSRLQQFERSAAIELLERFEQASASVTGHGDPPGNVFQNLGGILDELANDLRLA